MRALLDPLNVELDPETKAICDEVCAALEWFDPAVPGSTEMARALGVTWNWYVALSRSPDHVCRQLTERGMPLTRLDGIAAQEKPERIAAAVERERRAA